MTREQIKPGKLYLNKNNKFVYDTILCVTAAKCETDMLVHSYIEYHWIKAPNKTHYTTFVTALLEWEPIE